jgi:tetratricopeptide (TPR) repeat protein/energy-coupling factor transporter ATP-binding protein EcfA2
VRYAAPEQFKGRGAPLDGRADLYALGLLLYEMATGSHPFAGDDFHVVMRRQMSETPRPAGEVNPQLSPFFEELLKTLLQKDADKRFGSAADLLAALTEGEKSPWWHERAIRVRAETKRPLRRIRIPRETAIYGREAELAKLRALYEQAKAGEGQVVFVEGEAGIGKSRLVDEFVGLLQREGEDVHFLFGSYPPGGAATASGAFSTAYREHFGEETLEEALKEALPVTPLLVPAFAALLRGDAAPQGAEPLTKDSLQTVFVHATRSLAKERTTIVLIDDLHFAPEEGRGLFASLALATPGHRILLVGTARPGLPQDWLVNVERTAHVTRLPIGRLGPKDLGRLLADTLKSERLAEELAGRIGMKSDGNPFFVFEILRGLREGQFLTQRPDGTWVTTQILHDIQVPSTIQDLVRARIGDLDAEDKDLLDVASCLGFEFDAGVIADALGAPRLPVLRRLARIEARHRLVRAAGERFVFDHHQVQETLYGALPAPLAREYHAVIAEAIERRTDAVSRDPKDLDGDVCVQLCDHLFRAGEGRRAVRYLSAGQAYLKHGELHAQVVELTERALDTPGTLNDMERCEVLLGVTYSLRRLSRSVRLEECAREALGLATAAGEPRWRCTAADALGQALKLRWRHDEAIASFQLALELARSLGNRRWEAIVLQSLGETERAHGRFGQASECFAQVLLLAREVCALELECCAEIGLGCVGLLLGRWGEAREHLESGLRLAKAGCDRDSEGIIVGNLGAVCDAEGRHLDAKLQYERRLDIARQTGSRFGEVAATVNLGVACLNLGIPTAAKELCKRGRALAAEVGQREFEGNALLLLAILLRDEGDECASEAILSDCVTLATEFAVPQVEQYAQVRLGVIRAGRGDREGALRALATASDRARCAESPGIEALAHCARATIDPCALDEALTMFETSGSLLDAYTRREARLLLWTATRDLTHLREAKRLLDDLLAKNPPEYHEGMLTNVRVNREIVAAAKEHLSA